MKMFGSIPLKSEVGIVRCIDCDKPVLRSAYLDHKCASVHLVKFATLGYKDMSIIYIAICASVRNGAAKKAGKGIEGGLIMPHHHKHLFI
jgi:hypothetical protein